MKKLFSKKNLYLFFLLYTLLTLAVSIFNLAAGKERDPLGFWHEIYRFFFLLILLLLIDMIRSFSFRKGIRSILDRLWPLLLSLLAFGVLLYLKGDLDLDMLKKGLLYLLALIAGLILLSAMYSTMKVWLRNMLSASKKKYFSFRSILLTVLILIPWFLYFMINTHLDLDQLLMGNAWYFASAVVFVLAAAGLLLTQNEEDMLSVLTLILLLLYYIFWFMIGYGRADMALVMIMQTAGCAAMLAYENENRFTHCIPFTILLLILLTAGAYFYFK